MKVLLIDVNCKHSSTGKIVYDLYTELNNSGHEAAVCYGRGPLIKEKNILKFGIDLETYFHAGMTRLTGLTGFFSLYSTIRLIKYINKFKPDIVHIHELHAYFVNIGRLMTYLKSKNIKTVWTFHCEFMYTGKCGHAHECEKFKKECNNCPQLKEYPKSMLFDFTRFMFLQKKKYFEGFSNLTIVTPSKWLANRVKSSFLKSNKIHVINNGVDYSLFKPSNTNILRNFHGLGNKTVILSVAPAIMSINKGGNEIFKIAKELINENIVFIVIGSGRMKKKHENILMLGDIYDKTLLSNYYSLADFFLICSLRETFPTTCLESLACGTRIIGYKSGGTEEIVKNSFGELFEYGDKERVADFIKSNLNIQNKFSSKIELSKLTETYFSIKIMMKNYMELYLEIYNEKN